MKCFHHNDLDGRCAAFWVKKKYPECELHEIDYNQTFPYDSIAEGEKVFIVDYSLPPSSMALLFYTTGDVTWIDHHESAIRRYEQSETFTESAVPGVREVGTAACVLTRDYLFPDREPDQATELVGDWDVWRFAYGEKTELFHYGLLSYNTDPKSPVWENVIGSQGALEQVLRDGKTVRLYQMHRYTELLQEVSFETEFEGYNCLACNVAKASSELFNDADGYDIYITFHYDGGQWTVSLYSDSVNVARLAEKYGGGGHAGAAGFQCSEILPRKERLYGQDQRQTVDLS